MTAGRLLTCFAAIVLAGGSANHALAESRSSSGSSSTTLSGSTTFFSENYSLSSGIAEAFFQSSPAASGSFSFVLPSMGTIVGTLTSATVDLTQSGPTGGSASASVSSYGAVTSTYTYSYSCGCYSCNCGWGGCSTCCNTCYGTGYYGYSPQNGLFAQNSSLSFSQISAGGLTKNLPSGGGVVNLLALGFGPEIQAGDSFTVTGTRYLNLGFGGFSSTGSNAYTYTAVSGINDLTASGTLDASFINPVPEPAGVLLLGVVAVFAGWQCRRRANAR